MKRNYTLNRFYKEAKALIDKHNLTHHEYYIRVHFEIFEDTKKSGSPRLNCIICYEKDHNYLLFASKRTPEAALRMLEEKILESTDIWPTPQNVSIDLTKELIFAD